MPTLEHQGRTLQFIDEGSGPPALLFHSGGLSSRQWRGLVSQLRATNRVLAPDFIGYGGSTKLAPGDDFQFSEDVELICALLATLDAPAHFVGHSYGGLVGLHAAKRNPAWARSIAMFEPVAFGVLHGIPPEEASGDLAQAEADTAAMQALANDGQGQGGGEAWMERFVDWWQGQGVWRVLPESSRAAFLAVGRKTFLEVRSLLADQTPGEAYREIKAPALFLTGERSPRAAQQVCARLAASLPNARCETIPQAGHMGPLTHMSTVNALIARHVAQVQAIL